MHSEETAPKYFNNENTMKIKKIKKDNHIFLQLNKYVSCSPDPTTNYKTTNPEFSRFF